jgi:putative membrane protein
MHLCTVLTYKFQAMFYSNFGGMNLIWWIVWMIIILWIFATPYNIPGQRTRKESALDILQKRFASGAISIDEYQEKKKIIDDEFGKTEEHGNGWLV